MQTILDIAADDHIDELRRRARRARLLAKARGRSTRPLRKGAR
jgi:hypothetical protein